MMDNVTDPEEAKQFLLRLGLRVREDVVRQVVNILSGNTDRSLYSTYAGGPKRRPPICGKGTAYKIKRLHVKGTLKPYLEYLSNASTIDQVKHKQVAEPEPNVPKEPGTKQEPYEEAPHKETMRKLAGKLAERIDVPSLLSSDLQAHLPVDLQPGIYCLSIGVVEIHEDKEIEVDYHDMAADLAAPHLVDGLYDHLQTSGLSRFVELVGDNGMLRSWVVAVGQYSEALLAFLRVITDKVTSSTGVSFRDEGKPGLTKWFITTIWIDAIRRSGGHSWIADSWYETSDKVPYATLWRMNCGTYCIGIATNKTTLNTYKDWHKQLRLDYARDPLARAIVIRSQELSRIAGRIRQRLWEFSKMDRLPGRCELCQFSGKVKRT